MLTSLTIKEQYKLKRIQRKQKNNIKRKIIYTLFIAITIFTFILYILPPITPLTNQHNPNHFRLNENILSLSSSRTLLENSTTIEESDEYPEGYPPDLLSEVRLYIYIFIIRKIAIIIVIIVIIIYIYIYRKKEGMEDGYYIL